MTASGPYELAFMLNPTPVKTSACTAQPQDLVLCDASAGSFTVTLPAAPVPAPQVAVMLVRTSGGNTVTVTAAGGDTFNNAGATRAVTAAGQCLTVQYDAAAGAWLTVAGAVSAGLTPPAGDIGGTTSAPTVVSTHLSAPLPVAQGGTASGSRVWAGLLTPAAVKTSAYAASPGDYVPCDTTSGAFTITLPAAPADLTVIAAKMVKQGGTNAVTIAAGGSDVFNIAGGSASLSLALLFQGVILQYSHAAGIWYVTADDLALAQLDARYVASLTAADTSVVVGGTASARTVRTATLDVIASADPPAAAVGMNGQKLTGLANGSANTDSAAFGQIPLVASSASSILPVSNAAAAGSTGQWADAGHVHPDPNPLPADFSFVAWTMDPVNAGVGFTPAGGSVCLSAFWLREAAAAFNNITVQISTAGTSLTANECFCAIYSAAGTRLGVTADQSGNWTTGGRHTMALTSAYSNPPAGMYWVAFLVNGTGTIPIIRAGVGGSSTTSIINTGLSAALFRCAIAATTQSSMPGSFTPSSLTEANSAPFAAVIT